MIGKSTLMGKFNVIVMINQRLRDILICVLGGIIGFVIGFLQHLPHALVYEDPSSFRQGVELGVLGFVFFFSLGLVAYFIR